MGSKTISLDDEAYGLLKSSKLPAESFSDVVKRTFSPGRPKLAALAGLLTKSEGAALERSVQELRRGRASLAKERRTRLWR